MRRIMHHVIARDISTALNPEGACIGPVKLSEAIDMIILRDIVAFHERLSVSPIQ